MSTRIKLGLFSLFALACAFAAPLHAQDYGPFFDQEIYLGNDNSGYAVFYLKELGYYTYLGEDPNDTPYPGYLYKYNFGFLYSFGNSGGNSEDVYLYDFGQRDSLEYIYTALDYGSDDRYFYFYAFDPYDDALVYFQDSINPREFYDFDTQRYADLY